jgi:GcrA cell cycle regulator
MVHRLGIATDRPTRVALPNPMSGKPAASARWAAARAKMESIKTAAVKSAIAEGPKICKPPSLPKLIIDDIPLGQRLGLLDLPFSGRCKWPCGDPGKTDFFFCGAVVRAGAQWPYCEMHHERSVSPALWKPAKEPTT